MAENKVFDNFPEMIRVVQDFVETYPGALVYSYDNPMSQSIGFHLHDESSDTEFNCYCKLSKITDGNHRGLINSVASRRDLANRLKEGCKIFMCLDILPN